MNCELKGVFSDYSIKENWMNIPEITKEADTIYLYPTSFIDPSPDAPSIATIDNEAMRAMAKFMYDRQAAAFMESTNVFAPYYRQSNLSILTGKSSDELLEIQSSEQKTDVFGALDHYFEHYNEGRPFILAGHSQGSVMCILVLCEYMAMHPEYYDRMIAAYVLGFGVTQDELDKYPHLKFAQGEDDTGVIISWNTEGPENRGKKSILVPPRSLAINPINWKRNDTYAPVEENLGSRIYNMETGEYIVTKPGVADAQVDTERASVICTTLPDYYVTSEGLSGLENPFGPASLHGMDYDAYFYNLVANVRARVEKYTQMMSCDIQEEA